MPFGEHCKSGRKLVGKIKLGVVETYWLGLRPGETCANLRWVSTVEFKSACFESLLLRHLNANALSRGRFSLSGVVEGFEPARGKLPSGQFSAEGASPQASRIRAANTRTSLLLRHLHSKAPWSGSFSSSEPSPCGRKVVATARRRSRCFPKRAEERKTHEDSLLPWDQQSCTMRWTISIESADNQRTAQPLFLLWPPSAARASGGGWWRQGASCGRRGCA